MDAAVTRTDRGAAGPETAGGALPAFATGPVVTAMAALAALLGATSQFYGFHRDELYFRMLEPAWGYVDQPPLTPFLARAMTSIVDEPWMLRLPAIAAAVATVLVIALVARELGGGRRAQALAAWAAASAAFPMVFGHVFLTASLDLVAWTLASLLAIRAVRRDAPWQWCWFGLVVGLATWNKLLVAVLVAGFALGILLFGPRRILRAPQLWLGAAIALVLAAPNLAYQVLNDWPQLRMGAALAEQNGDDVRVELWPFLLLMAGPFLVPVWIAGMIAPFRRRELRDVRFVVVALPVVVLFTFVGASQSHYPAPVVDLMLAFGAVPVADWMRTRLRRALVWTAVALNAVGSAVVSLPLLPAPAIAGTFIPDVNITAGDSVGWPEYVRQIADASRQGPPGTVVVTSNYGEAGAVARYGEAAGIDDVAYSGHNALSAQARPPESAESAVFVGGIGAAVRDAFAMCAQVGSLDNGIGVDNEEQGVPLWLCTEMTSSWDELWPRLAHLS